MTRSFVARPLILLAMLSAAACAEEEQSGTLSLQYELGIGVACDAAQLGIGGMGVVETVRVTLTKGAEEIVEEAPCVQDDTILIASAPAGNYELLVEGLDAVGDTVMDNLKMPETDNAVEVIGGTSQNVTANLAATPARIDVRLNIFKDGGFVQCQFADVQFFDVTAFRASTPMITHQFDYCLTPGGYQTIPDPDRVIEGALLDGITIDVLDMAMAEVESITPFTFTPPGAGKFVQLTVSCDGTDCSGSTLDAVGSPPPSMDESGGDGSGG